jgi:hypothetical protein
MNDETFKMGSERIRGGEGKNPYFNVRT